MGFSSSCSSSSAKPSSSSSSVGIGDAFGLAEDFESSSSLFGSGLTSSTLGSPVSILRTYSFESLKSNIDSSYFDRLLSITEVTNFTL